MNKPQPVKVVLLANHEKPASMEMGNDLKRWLTGRAQIVADNFQGGISVANYQQADLAVVMGGDGTILGTVRSMGTNQIPIIGVNSGKLGFLAEFTLEELKQHFNWITSEAGRSCYTRRIILQAVIQGPHREPFRSMIVNELAVIAGPPFRMIEVSVWIGGEHLALCAGDGLIIATPTGSTAYNLSAGGPILAPTIKGAVITPLAAHSLNFRPIVVDLDKPITVQCRDNRARAGRPIAPHDGVAAIDGQINTPLHFEDTIEITPSPTEFILIRNPAHSQWQILNAKLHWGELPGYSR